MPADAERPDPDRQDSRRSYVAAIAFIAVIALVIVVIAATGFNPHG